jgi:phosphoglucosamine mutase
MKHKSFQLIRRDKLRDIMRTKKLFGTRGIRGPIATKVTPELALKLGLALASQVGKGDVVLAKDARTSGTMLGDALTAGILAGGCDVVDIGMAPSPCVAFTTRAIGARAGVIITASHNPPTDNGFAFYGPTGMEFLTEQELGLEDLVFGEQLKRESWDSLGSVRAYPDAISNYIGAIKRSVKVKRGFKVVLDCSNGAGSLATPYLLRELGCKVITLNSNPDGHFPGRPSEPQPWNLGDLMNTVRELGADVGLAHDGDADRIAAIDENGKFIKHDTLIALFAERAIRSHRGGIAVTSINTSVAIEEVAARAGGHLIRTSLGNMHAAVLEHNAVFAAEPGKFIFPEFGGWQDGILCAAKVLEMMSFEAKPISKIVAEVPDYYFNQEDFPCPDDRKVELMRNMREYLLANVGEVRDVLDIDGLRVNRKDGGWLLVRTSGTEPKVRIVLEGRTQAEANMLRDIGLKGINKFLR